MFQSFSGNISLTSLFHEENNHILLNKYCYNHQNYLYYAMFHAAKAVLFSMGLREKKHFAVTLVLEILSKEGKLEARFVNEFAGTQHDREEADYHYNHNKVASENALSSAQDFVKRMKEMLASNK
ncbi:MAG: HEPN domain-containing protein [Nanoarchaeota archaeon]